MITILTFNYSRQVFDKNNYFGHFITKNLVAVTLENTLYMIQIYYLTKKERVKMSFLLLTGKFSLVEPLYTIEKH